MTETMGPLTWSESGLELPVALGNVVIKWYFKESALALYSDQ